jgi:hypothetical protein
MPRAVILALTLVFLASTAALLLAWRHGRQDPRPEHLTDHDIALLARRGDLIRAMRWYRSVHGGSAKAAKAAVLQLAASKE